MKITHIGIWTKQLEVLRSFYTTYFQGKSHAKYVNPKKGFESYMLHFEGGCTLEIMSRTDVDQVRNSEDREFIGFAHLAFSTGSKDQVDRLTERLRQAVNDETNALSGRQGTRSSENPVQPETVFTKV